MKWKIGGVSVEHGVCFGVRLVEWRGVTFEQAKFRKSFLGIHRFIWVRESTVSWVLKTEEAMP